MSVFDDTDLHEHVCENEACSRPFSCTDPFCETHHKYCLECAELMGVPQNEDREERYS